MTGKASTKQASDTLLLASSGSGDLVKKALKDEWQ